MNYYLGQFSIVLESLFTRREVSGSHPSALTRSYGVGYVCVRPFVVVQLRGTNCHGELFHVALVYWLRFE